MHKYWIYILIILPILSYSQDDPDPYAVIDSLKKRVFAIHDYQVDIEIEVDVDFINMPVKHATLFYKQPDKIKFKSDEFIMLPKKGFDNQFQKILNEPYNAIYTGTEEISGKSQYVIKVIPMGKKPDIILATWWIDPESYLITRTESNTRDQGTFVIDFKYDEPGINLPTEMTVSFEIEKISIPLKFIGKTAGMEIDKSKMDGKQEGKVYIRFSNYKINQSIDDQLFEEEEEPE